MIMAHLQKLSDLADFWVSGEKSAAAALRLLIWENLCRCTKTEAHQRVRRCAITDFSLIYSPVYSRTRMPDSAKSSWDSSSGYGFW